MSFDNEAKVIDQTDLKQEINTVLERLFKVLSKSYGPLGENTIIHKNGDTPKVTKDGLTILRAIRFDERCAYDIYQLIRRVSDSLVEKVGDGSTSAVLTSVNLYKELVSVRSAFRSNREFEKTLRAVQDILTIFMKVYLTKQVSTSSEEERARVLKVIASISNNNDSDIGGQIGQVMASVQSDSVVKIKLNPLDGSPTISINKTSGFQVDSYRLAHPAYFSRSENKHGIEVTSPFVITTYNLVEANYNWLLQNVLAKKSPEGKPYSVVILAETIQPEVLTQIIKDVFTATTSGKQPQIFLVHVGDLSNMNNMGRFVDLEAYVNSNASAFNGIEGADTVVPADLNILGHCFKASFLPNNVITFDNGAGYRTSSPNFENQVKTLREELDNAPTAERLVRANLKARLNRLHGTNLTIFVGGRTEEEKNTTRDLVEDSVFACQSVLREGYTLGANYAMLYAIKLFKSCNTGDSYNDIIAYLQSNQAEDNTDLVESLKSAIERVVKDYSKVMLVIGALERAYMSTIHIPYSIQSVDNKLANANPFVNIDYSRMNANEFTIHNTHNDSIETFSTIGKLNTSVISPVRTDIEILASALSIVTLLITSNQYIQ